MKKLISCVCVVCVCLSITACYPFFPRYYPVDDPAVSKLYPYEDCIYEDYYYYDQLDNIDYCVAIPFINIDSYDAAMANNEIRDLIDREIENVNDVSWDTDVYFEFIYYDYISINIAAVIIKTGIEATDVMHPDYYTYTFSLNTGYTLSYYEVCEMAGVSSTSMEDAIREAVTDALKAEIEDDYIIYVKGTMDNYREAVRTNEIGYVIDENARTIKVIFGWEVPWGRMFEYYITDIYY